MTMWSSLVLSLALLSSQVAALVPSSRKNLLTVQPGALSPQQKRVQEPSVTFPTPFSSPLWTRPRNSPTQSTMHPKLFMTDNGNDLSIPLIPEDKGQEENTSDDDTLMQESLKLSFGQRVRKYFSPDDGLSFRQRLAKMGLSCMLSYGWVSNMSYCVTVSVAWFIFSKQVSYIDCCCERIFFIQSDFKRNNFWAGIILNVSVLSF